MTIGEKIKFLRERQGMTQVELAQKVGVSDKAVSTWENGVNIPRMGVIQKIASCFGVSKAYLVEDDSPELSKRLLSVIQEKGMSYRELSEKTGLPKSAIQRYAVGETDKIPIDRLEAIAKALGTSAAYLMGWEDEPSEPVLPANVIPLSQMPRRRVRMIGSVAAGVPILADEEYDIYIDAPEKADYALRVEGDSMKPNYLPGDVIYIREQPDVDDGRVAVVLIDDSATLKHVYHEKDGLTLVSDNPAYPPMRMSFEEHDVIRVLGIVVGFTRMFGKTSKLDGVKKGMPGL